MKRKISPRRLLPLLFATPLAAVFPLSSCGLNQPWTFDRSTNHATRINYCLLIGQNDHADSIERTRATRAALNTLDTSEETKTKTKDNPNIAAPIPGYVDLTPPNSNDTWHIPVYEIEQMEQKSFAGATWDAITANDTAGTWIAKHGHDITFFVSNNDSMAEGAMWASNWIKGLPIFGYDANATTIQRINSGSITGTVDQNAATQCGTVMMMTRNMLEDRDKYWDAGCVSSEACNYYGSDTYNPMHTGFTQVKTEGEAMKYGWVDDSLISKYDFSLGSNREVLSKSTAIAHLEGDAELNNVGNYIKQETGEAKQPSDMFDDTVHIKNTNTLVKYNICQAYCNRAETYLVATLRPYFNEYARRLGLTLDIVEGDGTDEAIVINQIDARPTGINDFDAYLINMSKTTSTHSYISALAKRAYEKEKARGIQRPAQTGGWDDFKDRLDTPLIFWNRQPHAEDGSIDKEVMQNKYFKYTYFVGVDAAYGGEQQGYMIQKHIKRWFEKWYLEHVI